MFESKAAENLIRATGAEETYSKMLNCHFEQMIHILPFPGQHAAFRAAFDEVFTFETFLPILVGQLESKFSEAEMTELTLFFSFGVGKKWVTANLDIHQATVNATQKLVAERMPMVMEIFQRLAGPTWKWGLDDVDGING